MNIWGKGILLASGGVAALLLAVACGAEPVPTPTPRPPTPTPARATPTPTPTTPQATPTSAPTGGDVTKGRALYSTKGCNACHGANGEGMAGLAPKLSGLYGGTETLTDGSQVTVNDAYLAESIRNPTAKIVRGYQPLMVPFTPTDAEMQDIIAYIASLK